MRNIPLPTLNELGRDLQVVSLWRVGLSLASPFVLFASYFLFAAMEVWPVAVGCVVALSFVSFGSVSHDLVHRSLGLSKQWNEFFLTAIELLMLRSGRAYRLVHLNHHARFPHGDDPEGEAAHGSVYAAFLRGPTYFMRLWWWAVREHPAHRVRLYVEACGILTCVAAAISTVYFTLTPLIYVALAYAGTWVIPFATSFVPHTPRGDNPLSRTRRFRGVIARVIAFDHLYHLEHHLYPAVPHHRWRELAVRLDLYLDHAKVPVVGLFRGKS